MKIPNTQEGTVPDSRAGFYEELGELARTIEGARREITFRADEIGRDHIPSATDELDAVVGATEAATGQILDSCEALEELARALPDESALALTYAVTNIYEACNFQDITGQRIAKVVAALQAIETRIGNLLCTFGAHEGDGLTVGPALPHRAVDQAEIDRIFAVID